MTETLQLAAGAVVNVGSGRGFIIEVRDIRYVISAGHCLPRIPAPASFFDLDERTYLSVIGRLDGPEEVSAELLFLDIMGDIAVFGEPDDQELGMLAEGYRLLVYSAPAFRVGDLGHKATVWLLGLNNRWSRSTARTSSPGGRIWLSGQEGGIGLGMAGSPIITADGQAVGILTGGDSGVNQACTDGRHQSESGSHARLLRDLPSWMVQSPSQPSYRHSRP